MGALFSPPTVQAPPPPPPPPPAANPPTIASGTVQQAGQRAKMPAFGGTDLTGSQGTGTGPTAKAALLGGTSAS
jgi:hypothetical protein